MARADERAKQLNKRNRPESSSLLCPRMAEAWSNIEPVARELCERGLRGKVPEDELSRAVDRYWHCIAAELEAGLVDDRGDRILPHEHDRDLDAYRDWRHRHPEYEVPPSTPRILHRR